MGSLGLLLRLRCRTIANAILGLGGHSKLKILFIVSFGAGVLAGLFLIFFEMFSFLKRFADVQDIVNGYLFAMFFMSLMIMLVFSTCIIAFTSLFRSRESFFLIPCPCQPEDIFLYKLSESMAFSSWAFLLLGVPLLIAYGTTYDVPWYFYPISLLFCAVFVGIPAGLGGLITLLIAAYFPRKRKQIAAVVLVGLAGVAWFRLFSDVVQQRRLMYWRFESWVSKVLAKISFCQSQLLPSWWMSEGILSGARGEVGRSLFFLLVILSNALFLLLIAYLLAVRKYRDAWSLCQSSRERKYYQKEWIVYRGLRRLLFLYSRPVRLLILKDVKTFLRDPSQWSQVLLFVGLLLLYILNLRNLGYHLHGPMWKSIISFLNLSATALVLSTFTGRFVFPMLSLEGRKFWVLGLMPLHRRSLLMGKFFFALGGALLISETLIVLSDWMLKVEMQMLVLHVVTVAILCLGLSAISVGVGATFPNLREDNPAKIVAGFGGTLNLLISLTFVATIMLLMTIPSYLSVAMKITSMEVHGTWALRSVVTAIAVGVFACVIPLWVGLRSFAKLEF